MDEQILYVKKGRRYVPYCNTESHRLTGTDSIAVGSFRLTYCPEPGYRRHSYDVTPDTAGFMAACGIAQYAMEQAMTDMAKSAPQLGREYTPQQRAIIDKFRNDMAAAGALIPTYWTSSSPREIAEAGINAVRKVHEELHRHDKNDD